MSPRKEYFDEPLVKVDFLKARFPRTCPVCGAPATNVVRMKIARTGKREYVYGPYMPHRQEPQIHEMNVLLVQVCEDHAHPDDGTDRYQALCLIVDGLLLAFLLISLLFIGDRIWRANPIPSWTFLIISLFGIAMLFTYVAFSPNALEKAVKIVGFDLGMQNVLLAFKRSDYQEQFMNENRMTAELVNWIMRSDG